MLFPAPLLRPSWEDSGEQSFDELATLDVPLLVRAVISFSLETLAVAAASVSTSKPLDTLLRLAFEPKIGDENT